VVHLPHRHATARPDEVAVIDETGQWTWAEHNARVNRLLSGLRGLGHGAGSTVGLLVSNRHEYLEASSALTHGGYVYPPINWHFSIDEIAYVLHDSGAEALIADAAFADQAMAAAAQVDRVRTVVVLGGEVPPGAVDYEELLAGASDAEPEVQTLGASLMYTSGTTGRPKGVRSTSIVPGSPIESLDALAGYCALLGIEVGGGRTLLNAPAYHGGPWLFGSVPFFVGASIVMRQRFDPAQMLEDIDALGVTVAYCVPTHFVRLLRLPEEVRARFDGSSLRSVFHTAAPCPPAVKRQMIEWWGPIVWELYAATDAGIGTLIGSDDWLAHPGSVGRAVPVSEIVVVDGDGRRSAPGEVGTVYVKSLMGVDYSYLGDQDKTDAAHLEPGTVTVGDVGYVDEDGYLFLSDRKIDMVISGGVNIYPAEIEAHLIAHPAVADVAVFGVPDDEFGEQLKAAVLLIDDVQPSDALADELGAFCRDGLAGYKVPRSFDFLDDFPRTATGKLLKRELRDPYWQGSDRSI
jgi:long-chain acyl-CoA synthetase